MSKSDVKKLKLVLALTQDDKDGSMLCLAEAMRDKYSRRGFYVSFSEASTAACLQHSMTDFISAMRKFDVSELMIVGHSEYFTNKTNFRQKSYDIIPIANRTLGGLSLHSVSEIIAALVRSKRIPQITLLCCESATTVSLYESDIAPSTWVLDEVFDNTLLSSVTNRTDEDVSSLQYICSILHSSTDRCPIVSGLNGFGFIDPSSDEPLTTFPSELYHMIPDVNTSARTVSGNRMVKHDRVSDLLLSSCEAKTSPHMVSYRIERC